jgi:transcriptional regulator with XRE-family HTH domain/mannose-6-phosphate isomerase-like protein (cupin superfamily)
MIGARLRARRVAQGISLRQFARDLEISASFISQLETGKAQPSVATLYAICTALGISSDELFDTSSSPDASSAQRGTDVGNNSWLSGATFAATTDQSSNPVDTNGSRSPSPVVHPDERKTLVLDSGVTWESLSAYRRERTDFVFVRYDVGGSSTVDGRLIRHVGSEYGFVLSGTLEITLGFETYRLHAGDAISFDSTRPHRFTNVGTVPVEAIWFNLERFDT